MSKRHCASGCIGVGNRRLHMTVSASQLRAGRALLGSQMRTLAAAARVHRQSIGDIERGRVQSQNGTMARLIAALKKAGVVFAENGMVGIKADILEFSESVSRKADQ